MSGNRSNLVSASVGAVKIKNPRRHNTAFLRNRRDMSSLSLGQLPTTSSNHGCAIASGSADRQFTRKFLFQVALEEVPDTLCWTRVRCKPVTAIASMDVRAGRPVTNLLNGPNHAF